MAENASRFDDSTLESGAPIRNVSDTALWVAVYRAMESERSDALFNDPFARKLAGKRGEAIVKSLPNGKNTSWAIIVRTAVMDEMILRCIELGAVTVLNLAAGLDARPYRMNLPPDVHWYHVDLPHMIEFMQEKLSAETPRCQLEFVSADLTDATARQQLFERAAKHGPVLVITEGLLVYLKADEVSALANDLRRYAKAKWWISDIASPLLLKRLEKTWQKKLSMGNAPFQFAPSDSKKYFAELNWQETEFRSSWTESLRLKRSMPFAWFWEFMSRFRPKHELEAGRKMSGIILLESA